MHQRFFNTPALERRAPARPEHGYCKPAEQALGVPAIAHFFRERFLSIMATIMITNARRRAKYQGVALSGLSWKKSNPNRWTARMKNAAPNIAKSRSRVSRQNRRKKIPATRYPIASMPETKSFILSLLPNQSKNHHQQTRNR